MVGSDLGRINASDRDFQKLQEIIQKRGIAVHITMMNGGGGTTGGAAQTEIGMAVTKLSGGRYENIATVTRLATLLPELGKKIAENSARQAHLYRVTYERPPNPKEQARIGMSVKREGIPMLSFDGRFPQ
jgi:hypothetical protein